MKQPVQILYAGHAGHAKAVAAALQEQGISSTLIRNSPQPDKRLLVIWTRKVRATLLDQLPKDTHDAVHLLVEGVLVPTLIDGTRIVSADPDQDFSDADSPVLRELADTLQRQGNWSARIMGALRRIAAMPVIKLFRDLSTPGKYGFGFLVMVAGLFIGNPENIRIQAADWIAGAAGRMGIPGLPQPAEVRLWKALPARAKAQQLQAYLQRFPNGYFAERVKQAQADPQSLPLAQDRQQTVSTPLLGPVSIQFQQGQLGQAELQRRGMATARSQCQSLPAPSSVSGQGQLTLLATRITIPDGTVMPMVECTVQERFYENTTVYNVPGK